MRTVHTADVADLAAVACPRCGAVAPAATLGFKVVRDRQPIGFLALAPSGTSSLLPRGSMLVTQLWVRPGDERELIGTQLVHRAAGVVHGRGVRSLVALGTRGTPDCRHLPASWLDRVGFVEHVHGAQWRLDLRRTLPVTDAVRAAWSSVGRFLRPERPAPATRTPASRG